MDTLDLGTSTNIDLPMFKGANRDLSRILIDIVTGLRDYWPLTVRQVYYRAVANLSIDNKISEYRRISRNLTTLRRADILPWHCIEDRTRRTIDKRGVPNVSEFVKGQMDEFLNPRYYGRCYIQNQDVYVEVATEKDALSSVLEDAVWMYCTRLSVVRGQVSATMVNQMAERFDKAVMLGKRPVLLYLGDFDYSGVAIPKALIRNMEEHHGVSVELVRVALNPEQIRAFNLPENPEAGKHQDPNRSAFVEEYGDRPPVEVDALHPELLTRLTQSGLESIYDMGEVRLHKAKETEERALLTEMRHRVEDVLYNEWPGVLKGCSTHG